MVHRLGSDELMKMTRAWGNTLLYLQLPSQMGAIA